jgi:hypothetical protein
MRIGTVLVTPIISLAIDPVSTTNGSVTLSLAGYDYGWQLDNFHRRDSHPLDRRLASLHDFRRFTRHLINDEDQTIR